MRLNHLNLAVDDLAGARAFFETLFDFATLDQRGDALVVMTDGAGFTLVLSGARAFGGDAPRYPKPFHVGFILDAPDAVDRVYARLSAAGVPLGRAPGATHGTYGFYFEALGGILFEVSAAA